MKKQTLTRHTGYKRSARIAFVALRAHNKNKTANRKNVNSPIATQKARYIFARAFSSEAVTGSREENGTKQESRAVCFNHTKFKPL